MSSRHDLPDIYDDRPPRGPQPSRRVWPWMLVALLVVIGAGWWWLFLRAPAAPPLPKAPPPVRVVRDRPGGKSDDAKAALLLLRALVARAPDQCLATIRTGVHGSVYSFIAVNSCDHTRLGRWEVDVKTGAVRPTSPPAPSPAPRSSTAPAR